MKYETAFQYLARCGLTEYAMRYAHFINACKEAKLKTRRSLWDILGGKYKNENGFVMLVVKDKTFKLPIIKECCDRRGVEAPKDAIVTNIIPFNHRLPQKRWAKSELQT